MRVDRPHPYLRVPPRASPGSGSGLDVDPEPARIAGRDLVRIPMRRLYPPVSTIRGNNVDTVRATVRADLVEQTLRRLLGKRLETRLDDYLIGVQLVSHRGTRRMAPRTGGQIPVQLVRLDPMVNRPTVHPEPRRQCGTGTIGADIDPADIYSRFHDGRDGLTDALRPPPRLPCRPDERNAASCAHRNDRAAARLLESALRSSPRNWHGCGGGREGERP